jgi:hypothetical protein
MNAHLYININDRALGVDGLNFRGQDATNCRGWIVIVRRTYLTTLRSCKKDGSIQQWADEHLNRNDIGLANQDKRTNNKAIQIYVGTSLPKYNALYFLPTTFKQCGQYSGTGSEEPPPKPLPSTLATKLRERGVWRYPWPSAMAMMAARRIATPLLMNIFFLLTFLVTKEQLSNFEGL